MADATVYVRPHLLADSTVTDQVGQRIYRYKLPASPIFPAVRLIRVGGRVDFEGHLDEPVVQVDVFGDDEATAETAKEAVRPSLWTMSGIFGSDVVSKLVEITGPGWLPDPQTERPRWTWDVRLYVHP